MMVSRAESTLSSVLLTESRDALPPAIQDVVKDKKKTHKHRFTNTAMTLLQAILLSLTNCFELATSTGIGLKIVELKKIKVQMNSAVVKESLHCHYPLDA
jgi:hypothetical protein